MTPHRLFADAQAARAAIALATPAIRKALQRPGVSFKKTLHLVVLDPAARPGLSRFEDALMVEASIGDRRQWDADYAAFARDKALLSWRHGMDSRHAVQQEPHGLLHHETVLWGGVWLDGLVVAASGAAPDWDEAFSLSVAGYLRALTAERPLGMPVALAQAAQT